MRNFVRLTLVPIPKKPAVIIDLDGTLLSAMHRTHLVEGGGEHKKDWTKFHELMVNDETIPAMLDLLMQHKNAGDAIVLLSLRPERFRKIIADDLKGRGIPYDELFLRPEGNYAPGREVKRDIYRQHIKPFYDVKMAYDDWPKITSMWHEEGLPATLVTDPGLPPRVGVPAIEDPRKRFNGQTTGSGEREATQAMLQKWLAPSVGTVVVPPYMRERDGQIENVKGYTYRRRPTSRAFRSGGAVARLRTKLSRGPD